jgi:hypothetical protein
LGLVVLVNGTSLTTPQGVTSWEAWDLAVSAPDQNDADGRDLVFQSWSDGGARSHTITTPASDTAYTATLAQRPFSPCLNEVTVAPDGRLTTATLAAGGTQWFVVATQAGYSYSAEVQASVGTTAPGTFVVFRGDDGCSGVSTAGARNTAAIDPADGGALRLSFTAAGVDRNYRLRLTNTSASPVDYAFSIAETTLYSPAWATNGSHDTYYSFQNTTGATITATLTLTRIDGTSAGSSTISIPAGATASTNTASLGAPRSTTGTARVTHDGPPGALLAEAAIASFSTSPAYIQPVKFRTVRETR